MAYHDNDKHEGEDLPRLESCGNVAGKEHAGHAEIDEEGHEDAETGKHVPDDIVGFMQASCQRLGGIASEQYEYAGTGAHEKDLESVPVYEGLHDILWHDVQQDLVKFGKNTSTAKIGEVDVHPERHAEAGEGRHAEIDEVQAGDNGNAIALKCVHVFHGTYA